MGFKMGWNTNGGYYQKHVEKEGFSNKITIEQREFNNIDLKEIAEGIKIATIQFYRENPGVRTEEDTLETPQVEIEYVVEETKDEEEIDR